MKQIRELLRLHAGDRLMSSRGLALRLRMARSTVQDCLKRAEAAGLAWPLPPDLTDDVLEARLFRRTGAKTGGRLLKEPSWPLMVREMKRPAVTLMILWEEYRSNHPEGYGYSRFCELFREFELRLSPTMRQHHIGGDKLFVDYSGKKIPIIDAATGEVTEAEIFIGVLGASSYTYAEATWTQTLFDWIGAHVRMLDFIGGSPRLLVPDNLRSGVNKPSFYDPEINATYGRMADHYAIGVLPARPYRPRDKAKVEAGVRVAQFYILGRMRNRKFFSLTECNQAIREVLLQLNGKIMRRIGVSRHDLFIELDRPSLRSLPVVVYEYAEWKMARVSIDYHVELDGHYYSAPHALIRCELNARLTANGVELFHGGVRVAAHVRLYGRKGGHVTLADHMPSHHRHYAGWSADRFRSSAAAIGPQTEALITAVMGKCKHPEQGFRTCLGILNQLRSIEPVRAEAASAEALRMNVLSAKNLGFILGKKPKRDAASDLPLSHNNIRGGGYYH